MANPQPASTIYYTDGKTLDVLETLDQLVVNVTPVYGPPDANGVRSSWMTRGTAFATRTNGHRVWLNFANVCRIEEA